MIKSKNTPQSAVASDSFFSENGHPFVCFADISPNRGITSVSAYAEKKGAEKKQSPPCVKEGGTAKP